MPFIDVDKFAEEICNSQQIDEHSANAVTMLLRGQPTSEVEEVNHGYWKEGSNYRMEYGQVCRYYTCSNCRFMWELYEGAQKYFKRCPYCEFKMDMETKREV